MVVCKFFLQGTCKFGDSCKFEHQRNEPNRGSSTSILRQQTFPANTNNVDTNTLIRSVQNDMLNIEKGGQWLLSSYAPFKDKSAFPEFEDRSFEEVRLGFYEAKAMGTIEQYKQQLQMALQSAVAKIKALQNPSPELVVIIKDIYNSMPKSTFGQHTNFGQGNNLISTETPTNFASNAQTNSSVFVQQNAPPVNNIFAVANQKLFGQQNQFNNQTSPTPFSGNPGFAQPQANSVFNSQPQNDFFNKPIQNTVFNSQQHGFNQPQKNSVFPSNNTTPFTNPQQNIFNNMQPPGGFNNIQQNPPFSQANTNFATGNNIFQPGQTPFTQPPSNIANSPLNNSIFTSANVQPSNFINPQAPSLNPAPFAPQVNPTQFNVQQPIFNANDGVSYSQTSSSSFGNMAGIVNSNQTQSIFGTFAKQPTDENVYSKLENLSENEIKSFQASKFELGQIPERAPTIEMCN